MISPSTAQWPQESSAAIAPEMLSLEDLGGDIFGFTTAPEANARFVAIDENLVVIEVD